MGISVFVPLALALTLSTHVASAVPARLSLETAARVVSKETIVGTYSLTTDVEALIPNTGLSAGQACPKSISIGASVELPEGVEEASKEVSDAIGDVFGMSPDNWKISGNACKSPNKSVYVAFSFDTDTDSSSFFGANSIDFGELEGLEYSAALISAINSDATGTTTPSASTSSSDSLKCGDETYKISTVGAFEIADGNRNAEMEAIFKRGEKYLFVSGEVLFGDGDALVELKDGKKIAMESLRTGDQVKVAADHFSQVLMFTHRISEGDFEFVSLRVASSSSKSTELRLSAGHYLSVNDQLKAAQFVEVGDVVNMGDGSSANVVQVSSVVSRGLFNPQTADGNIVVNGVVTTTYTTAVKPAVAHSLLWPVRQLVRATGVTADLSCGMLEGRFAGFEVVRGFFASAMSWAMSM